MSFYISHRFGGDDPDPPPGALADLLAELDEDPDDEEHVSVSVVHESHWAISAFAGGLVALENVEDFEVAPRHMRGVERDEILVLFEALADGRLDDVFARPWKPGYGG